MKMWIDNIRLIRLVISKIEAARIARFKIPRSAHVCVIGNVYIDETAVEGFV